MVLAERHSTVSRQGAGEGLDDYPEYHYAPASPQGESLLRQHIAAADHLID
jgi:hypothetical protein